MIFLCRKLVGNRYFALKQHNSFQTKYQIRSTVVYRKIQVRFNFRANARQSKNSVSKLLSALCTATCKNLAAVSVRHSLAETVFHLSVALLGLVSSLHLSDLRFNTVLCYTECQQCYNAYALTLRYYIIKIVPCQSLFYK